MNLYGFANNSAVLNWDYLGLQVDLDLNPNGLKSDGKGSDKECWQGFGKNAPDLKGDFYVFGHGSPQSIRDDRPGQGGGQLDAAAVAKEIMMHSNFKGANRIVLWSCATGVGPESIAQQIADITGITVLAPTSLLWCEKSGKFVVCDCVDRTIPHLRIQKDVSKKGEMKPFSPRKKEQVGKAPPVLETPTLELSSRI